MCLDWRIPFLFTLGGLLVIAFGMWQWRYDKYALIPLSLLKNRTVIASSGAIFFFMLAMLGGTYQLPLFYQAVGRATFYVITSGLTALRSEDTPRKSPALTSFLSCLLPALLF